MAGSSAAVGRGFIYNTGTTALRAAALADRNGRIRVKRTGSNHLFVVRKMQRNLMERCDDAISSLKQELQELKEEYKENQRELAFLSSTNIKKALESFYGITSNNYGTNVNNAQSELVVCEQEIRFFKAVTGIELAKYLKKAENKSEKGTTYSHKLLGHCRSRAFEVEFKTLEAQTGRCQVIHINIHMDCKENSELVKLISRTQKSLNLLGFFRTLSNFTEWHEYRESTFSQFKEKYPHAVGLPHGSSADYMVMMNPDLPGCQLILQWRLTINEDGIVIPVLDLLPKIPQQAMALDQKGVVENAATNFKTLLQAFGLQGTIENLIQSFCMKRGSN